MPELPKQEKKLIKQIGSMAANGLFLCIKGDRLELILRGRFLGYRINPLMPITERSIRITLFQSWGGRFSWFACTRGKRCDLPLERKIRWKLKNNLVFVRC